jgi:hypothetical protein
MITVRRLATLVHKYYWYLKCPFEFEIKNKHEKYFVNLKNNLLVLSKLYSLPARTGYKI